MNCHTAAVLACTVTAQCYREIVLLGNQEFLVEPLQYVHTSCSTAAHRASGAAPPGPVVAPSCRGRITLRSTIGGFVPSRPRPTPISILLWPVLLPRGARVHNDRDGSLWEETNEPPMWMISVGEQPKLSAPIGAGQRRLHRPKRLEILCRERRRPTILSSVESLPLAPAEEKTPARLPRRQLLQWQSGL